MFGLRSSDADGSSAEFDDIDEFVPDNLPEPGGFLEGHGVLWGEDHVAFHEGTEALFEERGVYDVTFGYNLARLNLDRRHPDAGYRYAVDAEDPAVLRAEFTPTTEFCPQSLALAKASFRAWNGLSDRHEYDFVRVRVDSMHQHSAAINEELDALESEYRRTGELPDEDERGVDDESGTERDGGRDGPL
ncbi:hypothetical protein SAMN04487949_3380 [Halogranum gelatinilyticum]|uniref:DUF7998 domain-containing protein n=1 Tax=Halogranum gelatinilyticum TaxID=660521 RepID=A0A1G9YMM9_9EURY|nr:hypothetical protein [Halogranum gelatinilyticum]SDN10414.1 hypothetical protein SAMN04487949_3380 [Halogranum gelatinilyticum]